MTNDRKKKAILMRKTGMTAKQISPIIGVSQQTLSRWFKPLKDELKAIKSLRENLKKELLSQSEAKNPNLKEIKRLIKLIKGLKSL